MRLGQFGGDPRWGITVVRVMTGLILVVAGTTKWAAGIGGFIGFASQLSIPAAPILAPLLAAGEVVGGLLVLVGLGVRWVSIWFICEFLITALYVKLGRGAGWDAARIDLMMLVANVMLVLAGAGTLALDEWLVRRRAAEPAAQTLLRTS